jgi:soluble lytic murein transglycosylase-like protein
MTPLALALAALLALPTGHLPRHVSDLGGAAYVAHVATWIESAAHDEGIAPAYLAALLVAESGLDPNAVSSARAFGLGQINPRTTLGRELVAACRLVNDADDCAELNVRTSARMLKAALVRCRGDRRCAVARYRGAWPNIRPRDVAVVRLAQKIAFRMSWEGGAP